MSGNRCEISGAWNGWYSIASPVRCRHRVIQNRQKPQSPSKTSTARSGRALTRRDWDTALLYYSKGSGRLQILGAIRTSCWPQLRPVLGRALRLPGVIFQKVDYGAVALVVRRVLEHRRPMA